jgi:predicted short-subunit dehydrogenase-like oxidoreductase (DUF2520 family)
MQQRLNFIGCGQLGKTLGSLWHRSGSIDIGNVLTRSMGSAQAAVEAIGSGTPINQISKMSNAKLYLIASGDDKIEYCSQLLASSGSLNSGDIVFHCSGAQTSDLLQDCKNAGAFIASIHPIKSFANVDLAISSFAGTYCGVEGDATALEMLAPIFEGIGANLLAISKQNKTLYHAASVIASNYLVTLQEISIHAFDQAGINRHEAMAILEPIVTGTIDNIFHQGTNNALTGPIARGDSKVVAAQLDAMQDWDKDLATIYRLLGKYSIPLAEAQGKADVENLTKLKKLFEGY